MGATGYLQTGKFFADRFLVIDRIGEGTSAVVYKARDADSNQVVALKVWKGSIFRNADQVRRFRQEAEWNRRLNHPNVARVFESGEVDNSAYLVLEFLSGRTLAELMAMSGPFSWAEFLDVARPLCSALDHIHAAGIVHRDVKPSNLMYASDGTLKLTDLGIAREKGEDTTLGTVRGTLAYMAPEQLLGKPASPSTDLFAAGAILYQLLTGRRPFEGLERAQRYTAPAPQVRPYAPSVPEAAARVIASCLNPEPAGRPPSAAILMAAIASQQPPSAAIHVPAPPPPPVPLIPTPPPQKTLQSLVLASPGTVREAMVVFVALTRRLQEVEAAGEVHDPITPQSVRVRPDNSVELNSHARLEVTDSGVVPTARYGAPEVLRAGPPRSESARVVANLYSIGLVLYEILAGTRIFQKEFEPVLAKRSELGWLEWQWNIGAKPTPIDKLVPGIPGELGRLLDRMLEKDPKLRPQKYEEVERILQRMVHSTQPTEQFALPVLKQPPAQPSRRFFNLPAPVVAGLGAVAVTVLVLLLVRFLAS